MIRAVTKKTTVSARVEPMTLRRVAEGDHTGGGDHQDTGEGGERDPGDRAGGQVHDAQQHQGVRDGGEPGPAAGADVHRGAGDGAGGGHAAEKPGTDGGQALAHEFTVGVVRAGVGDRRGNPGRKQ